jgi:hypothetical protein
MTNYKLQNMKSKTKINRQTQTHKAKKLNERQQQLPKTKTNKESWPDLNYYCYPSNDEQQRQTNTSINKETNQ